MERLVGRFSATQIVVALGVLLCPPATAFADNGDISLGPALSVAWGGKDDMKFGELRLELRVDYGLTQFWSVRGQVGGAFGGHEDGDFANYVARALAAAGVAFSYDVWTLVPEVGVYAGVGAGGVGTGARLMGLAGLRYYLSRTTSLALSGGAEFDWAYDGVTAVLGAGVWL